MKETHTMLKIGEVAELNHISKDTLRYYDKIDLFKPMLVDRSGYRYYAARQLLDLDLILWLKMNGASLREIKAIMAEKSPQQVVSILEKENKRIRAQIRRMEDQYYANKYYISQMKKYSELGRDEGYLLEFEKRYLILSGDPIDPGDSNAYELSLKAILQYTEHEENYFNSFFGGIYPYSAETQQYEQQFYPMAVNIRNQKEARSRTIPKGIYAVMPVLGGFRAAYEKIPKLLAFVEQEGFAPVGDCYILKIWECWESQAAPGEILELQIPVRKI